MSPFLPPNDHFVSERLSYSPYLPADASVVAREMRAGGSAVDLALEGVRDGFGLDLRNEPEVTQFIEQLDRDWNSGERYVVPMRLTGDGAIVGELWIEDRGDGELDLGYSLWERFRGLGYATEAVETAAEHLFCAGALRLTIECDRDNLPSAAVARRAGFRQVASPAAKGGEPEATTCHFLRTREGPSV